MIRLFAAVTALIALTSAHQALAQSCPAPLSLTCQGTYLASGKVVLTASVADKLADEHWDEPSEANCAATVYLTNINNTSVRVYASLEGSQVKYDSSASQVYKNDQNEEEGYYSNTLNAADKAGNAVNLGVLHLANPVSYGTSMIMVTDVAVTCTVN